MKNTDLLDAMEGVRAEQVWETGDLLGYHEVKKPHAAARRFWRTALIAAVIAAFMGLTAYAVGLSIHQRRQQELRQDLRIEASGTDSYVEYPVTPGDSDIRPGVTILSAINDGQEQMVYVNVCPVSEEEVGQFPGGDLGFAWYISDTDFSGFAAPALPSDLTLSGDEEISNAVRQYAWDEETRTLTLECWIWTEKLQEIMAGRGWDSVELGIAMYRGHDEKLLDFGTTVFTPTEEESRFFDFGPVVYHDVELGLDIDMVGLELTPISAIWKVSYPRAAEYHSPEADQSTEDYRAWSLLEDKVCMEAVLHFSDGSTFSTGGALTCPYENGAVHLYTGWGAAVNIRDVQRITLGDVVLWEAE